jgi:vancomycin resistance protein YoaR
VAEDGTLTWIVDGEALAELILAADPGVNNKPQNAAFTFDRKHRLTVKEGIPGRTLDAEQLGAAVVAAGGTTARTGPIPYIEEEPKVTAEDLPTQDFTTRVTQFRTPLTAEPIRTRNLVRAAELVTGTVVKPGEVFDLTKTIEPITKANGYYDAHVIVNGRLTDGIGGGLSQMATTTYNAGYFAGMEDITHRPHSVWFPRYPAGRESTMARGSINVIFKNTTPYALMMSSYVSGGYLYVDIWSTPYFTVKTEASPKTNIVQPGWVTYDDDQCEAKPKGQPGFKITNTRWIYLGDDLVDTESFTWTYRPDNGVRCE